MLEKRCINDASRDFEREIERKREREREKEKYTSYLYWIERIYIYIVKEMMRYWLVDQEK